MLQKLGKIVHCNNFTCNERFFFMFQYKLLGFFVTLDDFAGFLCIKAMQRIEKFWVTIWRPFSIQCAAINCLKEHPTLSHRLFRGSLSGTKVHLYFETAKNYSQIITGTFSLDLLPIYQVAWQCYFLSLPTLTCYEIVFSK